MVDKSNSASEDAEEIEEKIYLLGRIHQVIHYQSMSWPEIMSRIKTDYFQDIMDRRLHGISIELLEQVLRRLTA